MLNYPVYVPSKGRAKVCLTPKVLEASGIVCRLLVEPQEAQEYQDHNSKHEVVVLDDSNRGIGYARTFAKKHSESLGEKWHWQIDDDLVQFITRKPNATVCPVEAMLYGEKFTKQFRNVGGIGYSSSQFDCDVDYKINQQIYSCVLFKNNTGFYWRSNCIEDTDYSLQILASGLCTVLVKKYRAATKPTMSMAGGATAIEYGGDRRMARVRGLQRNWPGLDIGVKRGCGLPKAKTSHLWRKFRTKLQPI